MIEFIKEENVWSILKKENKPIVVYGMGSGAEKIIATLNEFGLEVSDIFASDEFVRGHSFLGYKVFKYSEVCEKYSDFNVVLAFATHLDGVLENIRRINSQHKVFAPDVPVAGSGLFTKEYVLQNIDRFENVYNHLADDESKKVYVDIINFKISGKIDYLIDSFADKDDIYREILRLNDNESILDLGAYDGDTIREFVGFTNGKYNKIIALEPDRKNFKKLVKNTDTMNNIELYNMAAWDKRDTLIFSGKAGRNSKLSSEGTPIEAISVDELINEKITMIKMDIEGAELKALNGAENTIKRYLPKLYVCAYHRNEDLFALGEKILEMNENYKLYFRHSKYIPAWESNFYAVAGE